MARALVVEFLCPFTEQGSVIGQFSHNWPAPLYWDVKPKHPSLGIISNRVLVVITDRMSIVC